MLVTLNEVLGDAKKNKYAVGLFNTTNLEMAKGVLAAAEETKSPVIIGTAEVLLPISSLRELCYFLIPMAEKATVPVVLHFDHGLTEEKITEALRMGFTSVMYDCSKETYENNIKKVADMVKIAHAFGATVEGELGHVGANENPTGRAGQDSSIYTQPEQAAEYASLTGVDALAVAIGSAHGAYKSKPKLDIERLKQIAAITKAPLVLHGGSGLSDNDFRNCTQNGISKVNIFTDINCAAVKAVISHYQEGNGLSDLQPDIVQAVKKATMKKMMLFGSNNRA